jgi:uncharacterized phage protein gp47/JayE
MPWKTPTLKDVRRLTRDYVTSQLGARSLIPNSVLRIMSDAKAGLAHLVLLYIDWLSKQLLPDTAETEWLDRHGQIWLTNADGSKGRKAATYASGTVSLTGAQGIIVPMATGLTSAAGVSYETTEEITIGSGPTPVEVMARPPWSRYPAALTRKPTTSCGPAFCSASSARRWAATRTIMSFGRSLFLA